jgi:hypothetical protein
MKIDGARNTLLAAKPRRGGRHERNNMKALFTALTFGPLIALLVQFADAAPRMQTAREKAIHECNVRAQKYIEHTWGDGEIYTYRSCMAQHGQPE